MRHRHGYRKLGRNTNQRKALLRSLMNALITHERIKTTLPKAKETQRLIERLVTKARKGGSANTRLVYAALQNNKINTKKLMEVIGPRMEDRPGGYTRVLKMGPRKSDNAEMAMIEFVDAPETKPVHLDTDDEDDDD